MTDKATILIVDDSPSNIQVLAAGLKEHYNIKVATGGKDCLKISYIEPRPDLILLDIEMPEMDGYEVCNRLKKNDGSKHIPIIFVTGKSDAKDEEQGLLLGAVDYITKPINPAIVKVRVDTHVTLKQQRDKLEAMAMHDQLTELYNRHYLLEVASHKLARSRRHKQPLSLLMIDIDHFKTINDTHGHPIGDAVLQAVATLLNKENRSEDVVARFGGEEFVILLDQCDINLAKDKAEKLRMAIEALEPEGINLTVSIGVAELAPDDKDFEDILKRSDLALYEAKQQGRNRIVLA
jgi:diguanylate cyclase (GGDEF)-like protein